MYPIKKLHQFHYKSAFRKLIVNIEICFSNLFLILKQKEEGNEPFDIPIAKRKHLVETNPKFKKRIIVSLPFLLLLFSVTGLGLSKNSNLSLSRNIKTQNTNNHNPVSYTHLTLPTKRIV